MSAPNRSSGFNLDDYVTVAERVAAFYEKYPDGSLQAEVVELSDSRVVIRGYAYRTSADEKPGIAHSSLGIPGSTPYTRGSEVENAETSAIGRAIAFLGFEVKRGIATREEVANKQDDTAQPRQSQRITNGDGGLIGVAEVGKSAQSDFELRQTPEGMALGFRLKGDRGGIKVVAHDPLATLLFNLKDEVIGQRVTCWGVVADETFTTNKGTPKEHKVVYQVLTLSKIKTASFVLPAEAGDVPSEPTEAESVPLFDDEDQRSIDAALETVPA